MTDNIDEILRIFQEQQNHPEESLEQVLIQLLLNPVELDSKRIRLVENSDGNIIAEVREGVIINQAGFPEKIQEEIINVSNYEDGTPVNSHGICKCMTCSKLVKIENLSRCLCGKTCCVMCGKFDAKRGIWYCSWKHKLIGKFLGLLGMDFR